MSQRRITDAAACEAPMATLKRLRRGYASGDSDLAWSRLTNWRGLGASTFEIPPVSTPTAVEGAGTPDDPSVVRVASWLEPALGRDGQAARPAANHASGSGGH